jgi:hypothetical protein
MVDVADHRALASARHFNDLISSVQELCRIKGQGIAAGAGAAPTVFCHIYHYWDFPWTAYQCTPDGPIYPYGLAWAARRGSLPVRGLPYNQVPTAYQLASSSRVSYPDTKGWVRGADYLLNKTALDAAGGRMQDLAFYWHFVLGEKTWAEDSSAVGAMPDGESPPADGKTYATWSPAAQAQCCNDSSCIPRWAFDGLGTGWTALIEGEAALEQSPDLRYYDGIPIYNGISVGEHEVTISGSGASINLSDFFVKRNDKTGISRCYVRVKATGLVRYEVTGDGHPIYPTTTSRYDGIAWMLYGRKVVKAPLPFSDPPVMSPWPIEVWEPIGGTFDARSPEYVSGKWVVVDATDLCRRMIELKDSIYSDFALMPAVIADYVNATDVRSVLTALLPKVVWAYSGSWPTGTQPADDPIPETGAFVQYTYNRTSSESDWVENSGDTYTLTDLRRSSLGWTSIEISPALTDFNIDGDIDSFAAPQIGNKPRMD